MPASFCNLARSYRLLETIAFGPVLMRARLAWLDQLRSVDTALLLGDGDGRFLSALLKINPGARITSIDVSPGMIEQARQLIHRENPESMDRIEWRCLDIHGAELPTGYYQAVVTHFFLDCFTPSDAAAVHARIRQTMRPDGRWVWSDFVIPEGRFRACLARASLASLYSFFRWKTGISARRLPAIEPLFLRSGLTRSASRPFLFGMIESSVWRCQD